MTPASRAARVRRLADRVLIQLTDPRRRARLKAVAVDPERRRRAARRAVQKVRATRGTVTRVVTVANPRGPKVSVPVPELPTGPVARPGLTVGVILDPFSALALGYEWDQVTFGPDDWREVLSARRPAMLFVESAWRGNDGRWRLHMTRPGAPSAELRELTAWCREQQIPTVFWNKEDPPNYDRFIETAKLFDHVFTVDADRIPAYREDLGHDRVGLLPFGAQPRIHNPIQRGEGREHDVVFAGSYFADKHPERRAQMDYVLEPAREMGLHIYSRMQTEDARYRFPAHLEKHIVGSLPYEQMLGAYTSYKVFLNVNSVTASPTMCARRLFELSAAQTPVVTAPAASVSPFFGETLTVVRDAEETRMALRSLIRHQELRDRRGLQAHRRVFDDHLYTHRVHAVLDQLGLPDEADPAGDPTVSAVVATNRPHQLDHVLAFIGAQRLQPQLVLVPHGFDVDEDELRARAAAAGVTDLVVRPADAALTLGACMNLGVDAADGQYVAKMDDDNIYTPNYLRDLVRAFSWTDAQVVGKWAHYAHLRGTGATLLRFPHAEHRYTSLVQGGTMLMPRDVVATLRFEDLPRRVDTTLLEKVARDGGRVYSADRFGFVSVRGGDPHAHTWTITDQELLSKPSDLRFYGDPDEHVDA